MDKNLLLCELLECGALDLQVIDGCKYDISDIIAEVKGYNEKITLSTLVMAIFNLFQNEVRELIDFKLGEITDEVLRLDNSDSEIVTQLIEIEEKLTRLNPFDDFELWFNYLDTNMSISTNEEIYNFYIREIDDLVEKSGLTLNK